VLLVGVLGADALPSASDAYVSLSLADAAGADFSVEHALTRTVPGSAAPEWDEVFAVGQHMADFDAAATLRVAVKAYAGPLAKPARLGVAKFAMADFVATADAAAGAWLETAAPLLDDVVVTSAERALHGPYPCALRARIWNAYFVSGERPPMMRRVMRRDFIGHAESQRVGRRRGGGRFGERWGERER
jgi:hypothetical protein